MTVSHNHYDHLDSYTVKRLPAGMTWFVPLAEPVNASLLFALANLAVLFVVLWVMDRKGIYLKA